MTGYTFTLDSFVTLKDQDRVMITTPPTVSFGPDGLTCSPISPDPVGVTGVSCEIVDANNISVQFQSVTQETGKFSWVISGMKNPPNFRRSDLFSDIYMQTGDYFKIQ